jgi:hypothetical protein
MILILRLVFTLVIGNEYRTLLIITSSLLLRSGGFLHPDTTSTDYRNTREYMDLSHSIKIAVDSICSSLYSYFGNYSKISPDARSTAEVGTIEVVCTLIAMWPLYCASKARGISVHQQEWIRNVLWNIGTRARIPKAMSLVRYFILFPLGICSDPFCRQWHRHRKAKAPFFRRLWQDCS